MRKFLAFTTIFVLSGCSGMNFLSSPPPVYVVFFPDHSTMLTADAKTIVDRAASEAKMQGTKTVQIAGPSIRIAPGYDPSLADPRMKTVEGELIADGIAHGRIERASETTDGVNVKSDPSGAQRVEIRLGDRPSQTPSS